MRKSACCKVCQRPASSNAPDQRVGSERSFVSWSEKARGEVHARAAQTITLMQMECPSNVWRHLSILLKEHRLFYDANKYSYYSSRRRFSKTLMNKTSRRFPRNFYSPNVLFCCWLLVFRAVIGCRLLKDWHPLFKKYFIKHSLRDRSNLNTLLAADIQWIYHRLLRYWAETIK